ncbi:MAG: transporter substrate-binding domain-containing protein [Rhizobacter sp.]|nr:transporter substrate-binding domain-containing protein [Bacteriovorax sp.]
MNYIYHPPESPLDVRYNYHWDVLKAALQVTEKKYGKFHMKPSIFMTEDRQVRELAKKESKISIMIRETNNEFESKFIPVRIPIDRNLIGYRVLLINKKDKDLFKSVNSLEDLKKFSLGQGAGWGDVDILQKAGFKVSTEVYYDKIFEGLAKGEYQAFPRAATEVVDEFEKRKDKMPELMIEENIMLYYPLPTYFWFSKTDHGRKLAARTQEGMETLVANGTLEKLFEKYYKTDIAGLKLKKRKLFKIPNPMLPLDTPFQDKRLWVDINNF